MMNKKTWIGIIVGIGIGLLAITAILLLLFLPSSQNAFPYENTPYQAVVNGNVRTDVTVINGELLGTDLLLSHLKKLKQ